MTNLRGAQRCGPDPTTLRPMPFAIMPCRAGRVHVMSGRVALARRTGRPSTGWARPGSCAARIFRHAGRPRPEQ
eukprot:13748486-Alexandrium_andersonii.AAC.1